MKKLECLECLRCLRCLGCLRCLRCLVGCVVVGSLMLPIDSSAHDLQFTYVALILKADGTYQADVTCDLDALAMGLAQGTPADQVVARIKSLPPEELEARVVSLVQQLTRLVTVRFDEAVSHPRIQLPERGRPPADPTLPTVLGLTARFTGDIPGRARDVMVHVDRALPPLYLTVIDQPSGRISQQVLQRGDASAPLRLADRPGRPVWIAPLAIATAGLAALWLWRRGFRRPV
jgi:hypothetical protein